MHAVAASPLRVAVVGAGLSGAAHVEAARRTGLAEVAAIVSSSPASARAAAERLYVPRAGESLDHVLADGDIDVVHNCTPTHYHAEIALTALRAGHHLITEKPLAATPAEAKAIVQAAESIDRTSVLCLNYRYYPMVAEARLMIGRGDIGRPHAVSGAYLQDWLTSPDVSTWRLDPHVGVSAAFADLGTHWCDLASYWLDSPIVEVDARLGRLHGRRLDDHGAVLVAFENGALGSVFVSQVSPGHKNALTIRVDGDEGSIGWAQEAPERLWIGQAGAPNLVEHKAVSRLSPGARALAHLPQGHPEGWGSALKNLLAATYARIGSGGGAASSALPSVADGLYLLNVVDAVVTSAEHGDPRRVESIAA